MEFIGLLFLIGLVVFVIKLVFAGINHGVDGMKDSVQRMRESKPEIREWNRRGVHDQAAGTDMRFCPYCGSTRTTQVCGNCGRT